MRRKWKNREEIKERRGGGGEVRRSVRTYGGENERMGRKSSRAK